MKTKNKLEFQKLRDPYHNLDLLNLFVKKFNIRPVFRLDKTKISKKDNLSHRYRLKYPKTLALVKTAKINHNDIILDPFSGTGGFCIASSFQNPKMLIGCDLGYGSKQISIHYDINKNIKYWDLELKRYSNNLKIDIFKHIKPIFICDDSTKFSKFKKRFGNHFVTKVISGPPFGIGCKKVTGICENESLKLFINHLKALNSLLVPNAKCFYFLPTWWINCLKKEKLNYNLNVIENKVEGKTLSIVKFTPKKQL